MDLFKNKFLLIVLVGVVIFGLLLALNWTEFVEGWESVNCD
ncbi:hypothetical protein [Cecembia sp.]|nr:hypothetical protein [Cecembia sp.]